MQKLTVNIHSRTAVNITVNFKELKNYKTISCVKKHSNLLDSRQEI